MSRSSWIVEPEFVGTEAEEVFGSLDKVFSLEGEKITRDSISNVIRVSVADKRYYVKRYTRRGSGIGQWFGRSKVYGEWSNLLFFRELDLPVPPIVSYGQRGRVGALITEEVPNTIDLAELAKQGSPLLQDQNWVRQVLCQVAEAARKMHQCRFAHNDFFWRNILVTGDSEPTICLIDCPNGRFWREPFLEYRIVKDLICLDKVAKHHLTEAMRREFYQLYTGREQLNACDKKRLKKITTYIKRRR